MNEALAFGLAIAPAFVGGFALAWWQMDLREAFIVVGLLAAVVACAIGWSLVVTQVAS